MRTAECTLVAASVVVLVVAWARWRPSPAAARSASAIAPARRAQAGTAVVEASPRADAPASGAHSADTTLAPTRRWTRRVGDRQIESVIVTGRQTAFNRELDALADDEDPMHREALLLELLDAVGLPDIPGVLAYLGEAGVALTVRQDVSARLVRKWAQEDVEGAAEWARSMEPGEERATALDQVAIAWVGQDGDAALAWARGLPVDGAHERAVRQVAYEVAREHPVESLALAVEMPPGRERDALIGHAALQWAALDPEAAAEWAQRVAEPALRERLLANIATAWADLDPVAAADMAVEALPPGRQQDDAVVGVVQRWAQYDPTVAVEWVGRFPESPIKEAAWGSLVSVWASVDATAFEAWLDGAE
jgi:hypothetical protein